MAADDCDVIVDSDVFPNAIQYDADSERIYWTDSRAGVIESARADGSDRYVVTR